MTDYSFSKTAELCVSKLLLEISESTMTNKDVICVKNANRSRPSRTEPVNFISFDVEFVGDLDASDQSELDTIIDNCIGYKENCISWSQITQSLYCSCSDSAQESKFYNCFTNYPAISVLASLKKYDEVRTKLKAYVPFDTTDDALIDSIVPAGRFTTI